jgi:hypothetical protein
MIKTVGRWYSVQLLRESRRWWMFTWWKFTVGYDTERLEAPFSERP